MFLSNRCCWPAWIFILFLKSNNILLKKDYFMYIIINTKKPKDIQRKGIMHNYRIDINFRAKLLMLKKNPHRIGFRIPLMKNKLHYSLWQAKAGPLTNYVLASSNLEVTTNFVLQQVGLIARTTLRGEIFVSNGRKLEEKNKEFWLQMKKN